MVAFVWIYIYTFQLFVKPISKEGTMHAPSSEGHSSAEVSMQKALKAVKGIAAYKAH